MQICGECTFERGEGEGGCVCVCVCVEAALHLPAAQHRSFATTERPTFDEILDILFLQYQKHKTRMSMNRGKRWPLSFASRLFDMTFK